MKIRTAIEKTLISLVAVSIAGMALLAFWLVVARYVVASQNVTIQSILSFMPQSVVRFTVYTTTITEELLRFALIWVGLIGAAYVFSVKEHLAFGLMNEILSRRFPVLGKCLNIALRLLIIAFAACVLVWGGWTMVQKNMRQLSPIMLWRMGLVYSILPITGVLTCILELFNLVDTIKAPAVPPPVTDEVKISALD